jgi:hypothetical protein
LILIGTSRAAPGSTGAEWRTARYGARADGGFRTSAQHPSSGHKKAPDDAGAF